MFAVPRALLIVVILPAAVAGGALLYALGRIVGRPLGDGAQVWSCRLLLACLGVRVRVLGRPADPARLLVANHVSWIDVLALGSIEPLSFLAKSEVAGWPLIGSLARQRGAVFVDRRRRRLIPAINRAMAMRLTSGRSLLLFPEGTTYDGTRLGRFMTSHFACLREQLAAEPALPHANVQAATLHYSDPTAAWIGDATLVPHLWAVLKRPPLTCDIAFGAPVAVARGYDRKVLARRLAGDMEGVLHALRMPASTALVDPAEAGDPVARVA